KPVLAHGGSVYWNEYRGRWVMVFVELFGSPSHLGEVWYAEADTPVGPWVYAVKVATHDRYDFYNPKQHPMFDADGGRTIFFEGTYTNTFSGNPVKTPRYDYNQVLYKLDLSDPRLALPVPIYRTDADGSVRFEDRTASGPQPPERVAFFALDRPTENAIPIYAPRDDAGTLLTTEPPADEPDERPAFYGLPTDVASPPETTRPLYEFVNAETGGRTYSTDPEPPTPGLERRPRPVCLVWHSPIGFTWAAAAE
ncbi:MAG TPA: hypothetical protein VF170_10480, partial [Planctomycetaceae bacterium]